MRYALEHGSYYLYDDNDQLCLMCDEVAICFDTEEWIVYKHGKPENVQKWYAETRQKFLAVNCPEMIENLVIIAGFFPVEELNKLFYLSGYIQKFYTKLINNEFQSAKSHRIHVSW